jgi:hypothetical protein
VSPAAIEVVGLLRRQPTYADPDQISYDGAARDEKGGHDVAVGVRRAAFKPQR